MKNTKLRFILVLVAVVFATASGAVAAPIKVTGPDGKAYTVIDPDKDGWGEFWCLLYKIDHRDRTIDSDGDGLTDYHEMLFGTDPWTPNPPPRDPTAAEIAEFQRQAVAARAAAQKEWEAKLAEAAARMVELIPPGKTVSEAKEKAATAEVAALRQQAEQSRLDQPAKDEALDALAAKHGVAREIRRPDGSKLLLSGEMAGSPIYTVSHNFVAAMGISADEVWPASVGYPEASTGLNLTGAGQTLALWENDGGVLTNHIEFTNHFGTTNRVIQKDGAALDTSSHATAVAGTMAAGGNYGLVILGDARGVAYEASVFAYSLLGFKPEREAAAAGDATNPPVFVSNHSWGSLNGWTRENVTYTGTNYPGAWVWYGLSDTNFAEDYKFGFYTPDQPTKSDGCTNVDRFLYSEAPRHLLVFSCGNDRGEGPTNAPSIYFVRTGTNSWSPMTATRDWSDGDDGGYDSVSTPGTAKNVLTVGSCEDLYYFVGDFLYFGFAPSGNLVPSAFSGAGPTDDGRIKPDLVAVGSTNASFRQSIGLNYGGAPVGIISPGSGATNSYTTSATGTSFAAPSVSGGLGLLLQRYAQLYGALSASNSWRNSTLKAIAIDTADDVDGPGPDYRFGYGVFNARSAALRVNNDYNFGRGSLIKEFTLAPSNSVSWVVVSDGTAPLCVTAVWSDPPGPAMTAVTNTLEAPNPMLVNNLDLSVLHLDTGTNYLPWVLNPDLTNKTSAVRSAAATRGVDNRNNIEQVSIAAPPAGRYRVTVSHSGGLAGNPMPTNQLVSVTLGGTFPEMAAVTALSHSPSSNQTLLTFTADPGAYFMVQTATNLGTWTDIGSCVVDSITNSVLVTNQSAEVARFWRLRRCQ